MGENDGKEKRPEAAMVMLPQEMPEGTGKRHLHTRSEERNQVHEPYDEQPAKEDHVYDKEQLLHTQTYNKDSLYIKHYEAHCNSDNYED